MPTNDERREVAARLRRLSGHREVDKEFVHEALGLYMGECVDGYDPVSVSKLADLIEPEERTCRMEPTGDGSVVCSACRTEYTSRWLHEGEYVERYCPNCGARVEEEQ